MRRATRLLLLAGLAGCTAREPAAHLELRLPSALRRELASTDASLCGKLKVELTFDRTDDLAPPPIDHTALVPKSGAACTWVLSDEAQLRSGTYDLIVRFDTADPPGSCSAPLLVGAYVKRGVVFPFPEGFGGLTDADFISRPGEEAALMDPAAKFDPDGDGRDSLAEIAQGSDPCKPSSTPVPTLSASTMSVTETSTVMFDLGSLDADDVPHVVRLEIAHHNGPNVGTEKAVFRSFTDARGGGLLAPPMAQEHWSLRALPDSDPKKGAGHWQVIFVPDEPFVGELSAQLIVDDGQGNVLSKTATIGIHVQNVDDPTQLLFGDAGTVMSTLRFAEQASPAVSYRFKFFDQDLFSDVGTWTPEIASAPAGLTLTRDAGFWKIEWSPSNDDVLATPIGGYALGLSFKNGSGQPVGQSSIALEIAPLFNDAPVLMAPGVGELDLPAPPFAEHRIPFTIVDPDQSDSPPSCAPTVTPASGTTCPTPFSSVRCEPTGNRMGASWPFAVILTPAADYATACGNAPSFSLALAITDVPPTGASNGAQMISTATPLDLRTASVVAAAVVTGGAGAVAGANNPSPPLIDGVAKKALVQVYDAGGTQVVTLIDLSRPSPSFSFKFPQTAFCSLDENRRARDNGAVDEVHGRMLVISRGYSAGSCQDNGANLVTLNPPSTVFHSSMELCGEPFNDREGAPVADALGNLYIPCTTGKLARFDASGALSIKTISLYSGSDIDKSRRAAVVIDPASKSWLVWPDDGGLVLVDLTTFDQTTPVAERISMGSNWTFDTLDDAIVDPYRKAFLIAYNPQSGNAQLLRVRFGMSSRTLDTPLDLGNIGGNTSNGYSYMRLHLRDAGSGSTDPGPDLVVSGGSSSDPVPHIDLTGWSVSTVRPVTDYYLGGGSAGIFASPDKRYYVAPTTMNHEDGSRGLYLYRFDPAVARQFVTLPVPNGGADWAGRTEISESGNLMVISEADGNGAISVVYFVEAEANRDL